MPNNLRRFEVDCSCFTLDIMVHKNNNRESKVKKIVAERPRVVVVARPKLNLVFWS